MSRKNPSRRRFIKTTVAVTTTPLVLGLNVHAQGSGTIKIGLIGSGGRGAGAADQALSTGKDVRLVAVGDYFKSRATNMRDALKKKYGEQVDVPDERLFDGFQNALGVIGSEVDVVLIACAAKFHPFYSFLALQAGKHVFCEKPNAIDAYGIAQLEEAVKLAKEKNLCYLCGLHSQYGTSYQQLVEKIHGGAIGDIKAAQSTYLRSPYGVRGYPAELSELDSQVYNQYMFSWLSGDDFTQSLVHNVDRITWVLGGKTPTHAFGMGGRAAMTERKYGNVFDHHNATYLYEGDTFRYFATCRTVTGCYNSEVDTIFGTKGVAYMDHMGNTRIEGENAWKFTGKKTNAHLEEQIALMNAIRNGKRLNSDDYMIRSTTIAVLGQIASYTGQMIARDDMVKSKFAFKPLPEDCKAGMEPPVVPDPKTGSYPVPVPGQHQWW